MLEMTPGFEVHRPPRSAVKMLGAAALAVALGGCAVPVPKVPVHAGVPVPQAWSASPVGAGHPSGATADTSATGPSAARDATWWRRLGDPMLVQLVEEARLANTDVQAARGRWQQARALRDAAAAGLRPTLGVSGSVQRAGSSTQSERTVFDAGFDAAWELDLFGATRHGVAAQTAQAEAAAATLAAAQVAVAAEVALGYVQLRGAQARLGLAREILGLQEQTLQITQWRVQAGLASSVDLAQARTAVEQTRAQLSTLQGSVDTTLHAVSVLTGQPPRALQERLAPVAALPTPPEPLALDIPSRTLSQRPDVRAAELSLRAEAERVAAADAARRPTVQLNASLAWQALTLGTLGGTGAVRSLIASIGQPLFDGGLRDSQLAAQEAAFEVAAQAYRAQVLSALQEVEDALSALRTAGERSASLGAAAESARQAAWLASQRHRSGLVDFQVVLETQRTLLGVQDSLAGARTDWVAAHVRLYKALGGGWSDAS